MGQYHKPINLDRREFINPHALGDGLKLVEQGLSGPGGVTTALHVLLAVSNGRGGGDYNIGERYETVDGEFKVIVDDRIAELARQVVGRWGGDRVAIIGDYAEAGDIPGEDAPGLYEATYEEADDPLTDITPMVRDYLVHCDAYYHTFSYGNGDGWIERTFELERREGV